MPCGVYWQKIIMLFITLVMALLNPAMLYDFNAKNSKRDWIIVDDVVMGGRSDGHFEVNEEGHGHFYGSVSLENNGGFSSVRRRMDAVSVEDFSKVQLRIKGDGKRFQFRIKAKARDYYSYIQYFETSGEWETIELELDEFYASFRGRKLDMPKFDQAQIEECTFLIANYKAEDFDLLIDQIQLIN